MTAIEEDDFTVHVEVVANLHWAKKSVSPQEEQYRIDRQSEINKIVHRLELSIRDHINEKLGKL